METSNQNQVTEEEKKQDARLNELYHKSDKTEGENTELEGLKTARQGRYQKKIDKMTWEKKTAEEALQVEKEEKERLKKENDELRNKQPKPELIVDKKTVEFEGKSFYTDATLRSMVDSKEMTESAAYDHQQERMEAKITEKVAKKYENKHSESEDQRLRRQDHESMFKKYPFVFEKTLTGERNPIFDPNNKLYIESNRIYKNGYGYQPDGISKSIVEAERIIGTTVKPDLSSEFSVDTPSAPFGQIKPEDKEVPWSEGEGEAATRMYGRMQNPKTNRPYTEAEAIAKGKDAKRRRLNTRRM